MCALKENDVMVFWLCSVWDLVEADCRKALELDNGSTKVRICYQAVINLEVVFIDVCKVCHMLQCMEANQKLNSFL